MKLGWLLGWAGGFLWIVVLALVFSSRGQLLVGASGLCLATLGYSAVFVLRPWRFSSTRMWRLMLLPYLAMLAGIPWAIWGFGAEAAEALSAWQLLLLLPVLSPMFSMGWRRWGDASFYSLKNCGEQ
jgi:hypothetical protein